MIFQGVYELFRVGIGAIPGVGVVGVEFDGILHSLFHQSIALSGFRPSLQFVPSCWRDVYVGYLVAVDSLSSLHEGVLPSIVVVLRLWIAR